MKELWTRFKERVYKSWTMIWAVLLMVLGAVAEFGPILLEAMNLPEVSAAIVQYFPGKSTAIIGLITFGTRLRSLLKQ
jgi:hypothetical protein